VPLDEKAECTVCIPTYNQAEHLRVAIRSVLDQTAPVRLIVANDASPDNTADVLAELGQQHPFRVINHSENLGISRNLQILLRAAETPFLVRLDSDDALHPEYVRELMSLLHGHPEAGYAHCAIQEIDGEGRPLRQRRLGRTEEFQDAETALRRSVNGYQVAANILMFRREALMATDYGAASAQLNFVEDYDLSVRMADAGWGNVYSGKVLASYRMWAAPSRPQVGRKLREVQGVAHIFAETLTRAFRRRGWPLATLRGRRVELALANAEILDRGEFAPGEREEMVAALAALGDSPRVQAALGTGRVAWFLRQSVQWSAAAQQAAKRAVKRVLFRS